MAGGPATGAAQKKADLIVEADELWRFVGSKADVPWVWVALDAGSRRVLAMVVGDRSDFTARCLWESLPDADRDEAVFCTEFLPAYRAVIPEERHAAAGKDAGLTNHVERFWCTLRQRCARVVRKTLWTSPTFGGRAVKGVESFPGDHPCRVHDERSLASSRSRRSSG